MRGRAAALAAGVAASAVALSSTLAAGPAGATAFVGTFYASANSDGVRLTIVAPKASLSDTALDVGAPSAQATLDSLGASRAFASFPYPGEVVVAATGLVRTLSGAPLPDYPFYAGSDYPVTPKQEVGQGPYVLKAESGENSSSASSSVGLAAEGTGALGLARSGATVTATSDSVISEAKSTVDGLTDGPLQLGHVLSTATTTLGRDGQLTRHADTEVVGAMVGDTAITITKDGLRVADTKQSLPSTEPVAQALAGAGITVELIHADDQPTGATAPAIRVTQSQASGTKVIYVLGAASAKVAGDGAATQLPSVPAESPGATGSGSGPADTDPGLASPPADGPASMPPISAVAGAAAAYGPAGTGAPSVQPPTSFVLAPTTGTDASVGTAASSYEAAAPGAPAPAADVSACWRPYSGPASTPGPSTAWSPSA